MTMLMTETIAPTLNASDRSTMSVGDEKKKISNKRVDFADDVAKVVCHFDLGKANDCWYSKVDLKMFKDQAKALSDHLQLQPCMAEEIEEARAFTQARKEEGADQLLQKWHKLNSARRGLEKFVLSKEKRRERANEIKASRGVVLNLQTLLQRGGSSQAQTDQLTDMISLQYSEFAKPALLLAEIYAARDAETVKPYYNQNDDELELLEEDDDDDDDLEELLFDDDVLSVGSMGSVHSASSRRSISAKKVRRLADSSPDSKDSKKKRSSCSKKKKSSSSSSKKMDQREKSMRRIKSMDRDCKLRQSM